MSPTDIGIFMGCAERSAPVSQLHIIQGMAEKMASVKDSAPVYRLLCKSAHAAMVFSKMGHTAPAMHLKLVSESRDCDDHLADVGRHVSITMELLEPMQKAAFSEIAEGLGTAGRGLMYGSVGAGAGAGALYWLLSRHAREEDANLEAKKKQIDYYHNLSHELNESMRRKYHYDPVSNGPDQEEAVHGR